MPEPTPPDPELVDYLRASDLPADATIALYFAPEGRTGRVGQEIQSLQRGEIGPIRADIDPLTAFVVICFLEPTVRGGQSAQGVDATVRRFIDDLEEAMLKTTPELAGVLKHARRQRPPTGGQA